MKRIIVMGGSFNPPTIAHHRLMAEAIDALDAYKGIYVPVSDAYLKRKMRHSKPPVVLSPEIRMAMLESMCSDPRMEVSAVEMDTIEARTLPTLMEIQSIYPEAEIYFLSGADKLDLITHLADKREFLDKFRILLFSRDKADIDLELKSNAVLNRYSDRIVILPQPSGTEAISSSGVREKMLHGVSCREALCEGVWNIFKYFGPSDFPDVIDRFKGEYEFLSNSYPCRFSWEGLPYMNAEAAFQSSRCKDMRLRRVFCGVSGHKAIVKGSGIEPYPEWETERTDIMRSILEAKFGQNPGLMENLKSTGDSVLINGNNRRDDFWGMDLYSFRGENYLGKILMAIRDKEI